MLSAPRRQFTVSCYRFDGSLVVCHSFICGTADVCSRGRVVPSRRPCRTSKSEASHRLSDQARPPSDAVTDYKWLASAVTSRRARVRGLAGAGQRSRDDSDDLDDVFGYRPCILEQSAEVAKPVV
jgi:hypothetical protein